MKWKTEIPIPADDKNTVGNIIVCNLTRQMILLVIDIRSKRIPEITVFGFEKEKKSKMLYINYSTGGRCELNLKNGESTYLEGGELALNSGQAVPDNASFFYPNADYQGIELLLLSESAVQNAEGPRDPAGCNPEMNILERLYSKHKNREKPCIAMADEHIRKGVELIRDDVLGNQSREIVMLDVVRLLYLLNEISFEKNARRHYYTQSQVQIAKSVMEILMADLSKRYSAAELAEHFQISETSLKKYFSGVFGCGYSEYQTAARMKKAAEMLEDRTNKIADISAAVGFSSQSRFAKTFCQYYGVSPTEYRRLNTLKIESWKDKEDI